MTSLPESCNMALKEWEGVCDALQSGRQIVLLRKGGIEEGAGGFEPEQTVFWLFPTRLHQGEQGLRSDFRTEARKAPTSDGALRLAALAVAEFVCWIDSEELLTHLEPFHVWTRETVLKRFRYRRPGLWLLATRVFRRFEPWTLTPTSEQLGCKSWVELETPLPTTGLTPALDEPEWCSRIARLRTCLEPELPTIT
jgi:hypothetical protein